VPWRAREAEASLRGQKLTDDTLKAAAEKAFAGASPRGENVFKVDLGKRTLVRALRETAAMTI
jgi:xanthine dehydrogenase YagS FAD-binding subunit